MEVVVLGECGGYDKMGCGGVEEEALDDANFGRLLGEINVYTSISMIRSGFYQISQPNEPSISAGLSRSMRRMRPVDRARTRTLLATAAATKSDDMENCSDTRSMLNIGSDASSCALLVLGGA